MSLLEELESTDKKGLFKSNDHTVCYPTGFTVLDYANGYWTEAMDPTTGELHNVANIGIPAGSCTCIIGSTGNGKTTFSVQAGWNIVKNFDDGLLFIVDCEKSAGTERRRISNLLKTDYDEPRFKLIKAKSSIEDVLESFNKICELKEAGGKKFMYEIKDRSFDGKPFWMYVPTVYVIDSLPKFNSKEYNTDDLGNQIDQMKASKDVTRFYTNVLDKAWQYNINFLIINHIRPATNTNVYQMPPRGLMMINPMTETLPRGQVSQYYSSTYFRINSKKSNAYTIEEDGFRGFRCEIQLAKSKTNMVGTSFPVTFNSDTGFDPIYSTYEFASSLGLIKGRNPYLVLEGFEERKFNRKEFVTLMRADESFKNGFLSVLKPYYESLLGSKVSHVENQEDFDIVL